MGAEVRAALTVELCECIVRRRVGYLLSVMCLDPRQPRTLSKLCKMCMMYRSTSWSSCRLGPRVLQCKAHVEHDVLDRRRRDQVATKYHLLLLRASVRWSPLQRPSPKAVAQ